MSYQYPKLGSDEGVVTDVLGWLGFSAVVFQIVAPLPAMWKIVKARSTMEYSEMVYLVGVVNWPIWTVYTALQGYFQPLCMNIVGIVFHSAFILIFLLFHDQRKRKVLLCKLACGICIGASVLGAAFALLKNGDTQAALMVLGIAGDIGVISLCGAPLAVARNVIRTKSVEFMPFGLSLATFLSGTFYSSYALWVGDIYMAIPNNIGFILGVLQLILYCCYCRTTKPPRKEDSHVEPKDKLVPEAKTKVEESELGSKV